jgi:hypothetical protein
MKASMPARSASRAMSMTECQLNSVRPAASVGRAPPPMVGKEYPELEAVIVEQRVCATNAVASRVQRLPPPARIAAKYMPLHSDNRIEKSLAQTRKPDAYRAGVRMILS